MFYVLSFAGVQVLSCLAWSLFFSGDAPRMRSGTAIRRMFLIILGITAITAAIALEAMLFIGMIMLFLGPICGIIYFSVTISEIGFYREERPDESIVN